jgi:DNA repair exonuclease SbcCD ATPase subunit
MKLLSAVVRNYRVHREIAVDFDNARTLIGGPNESGKSTLMEAIHRALFLRATVTGEAQEKMVSTLHTGHPEVEVHFKARGAEYRLAKRFSGQSGSTRLSQVGGQTWLGEDAQSRLSGLLGVTEPGGGRGILDRVAEQWAHLWVWQGKSGDDPARHVASQQASVLQRLQQVGGAVAMQSELDGRVASWFSQVRKQTLTSSGAAKSGSDLARAQTEGQQAESERAAAAARLESLRQAVDDYEQAVSTLKRTAADLEAIASQRGGAGEKMAQVDKLRRSEETQNAALTGKAEKFAALEGIETKIAELRASVAGLQVSLAPMEEQRAALETKLADVRKRKVEAEEEYDRALESTREARVRAELAGAYVARFEAEERCRQLSLRLNDVRALEEKRDAIRAQIAELVPINQEELEALQAVENRLARSVAALEAMATGIEVVAADRSLYIGGVQVSSGESRTVSDVTEVMLGEGTRLRIHPGGGDSLSQARETVRVLRADLRRALDGYGLDSTAKALEMATRRTELRSGLESTEAALGQWKPAELAAHFREAEERLAAIQADIQRRMDPVAEAEQPATATAAAAWLERKKNALQALEPAETAAKATLGALRQQLEDGEAEFNDSRGVIEGERKKLTEYSAQLALLLHDHGADEARVQALKAAGEDKAKLEGELAETRRALQALQPELLEADCARLERAQEEAEGQRNDAETRRLVGQQLLRSNGAEDPNAALAQATARLEAAAEHLRTVSRKSDAVALIDDMFQQEQRALADQFSLPLAQKIDIYLQCLFGPEAQVRVTFENNAFKGVELIRSAREGAMSFEDLSEGAREQVAAAVRLAIAELLAADHDGSLPLVFDDAFAYSDPDRVNTLQRMLDLGASRGLQIIVLTCNPSDYAALGARQILLPPPGTS